MVQSRSTLSRRAFISAVPGLAIAAPASKPNVIIVLTDDQGYGDLSCHGNPVLRTPHLDRLHAESVRFTQFHSAPMCTPTRAQLMSGQDCLRNGACATAGGRSQLRDGIPTMADAFANGGYETGLFGKWHLGYNHPFLPNDRGFQEANYFLGYGITGAGDFWNNDYFDSRYYRNGTPQQAKGYCTDVWFDLAISWMDRCRSSNKPFFCYVPTNAPHFPEWVGESYRKPYEGKGPAEYFGMVANFDGNMGRLDDYLRKSGLRENTILIYMTDNGGVTGVKLFNAGMRGWKTQLHDGGHRVPCFLRWPAGNFKHGRDIETQTQVQDVLPTLTDLCALPKPKPADCDGASLAPLLKDERAALADRMLVVHYVQQRLEREVNAVIWNQWRLVRMKELYDIRSDPGQQTNIISAHPEIAARMRAHHDRWWKTVEPLTTDYVHSHIGRTDQREALLVCSEWFDVRCDGQPTIRTAAGGPKGGPWNVDVKRGGRYRVELRRWPRDAGLALRAGTPEFKAAQGSLPAGVALPIAEACLNASGQTSTLKTAENDRTAVFETALKPGRAQLHGWFRDAAGRDLCGAFFAYVRRS